MGVFLSIRNLVVYLAKEKIQIAKSTSIKMFTTGINTVSMTAKTVFLSAYINILSNSQSFKSNCQKHSHCTFASCTNAMYPIVFINNFMEKNY